VAFSASGFPASDLCSLGWNKNPPFNALKRAMPIPKMLWSDWKRISLPALLIAGDAHSRGRGNVKLVEEAGLG
jgi:hypothetical protein